MEPLFSEKQLQEMSKENMIKLLTTMQAYQKKQETRIQPLTEKMKELEFMCARWAHALTGESPQSARQWEGYSRSQGCPS